MVAEDAAVDVELLVAADAFHGAHFGAPDLPVEKANGSFEVVVGERTVCVEGESRSSFNGLPSTKR